MYPNLKVTLIDSLNKRIIFLNEVIKELDLKDIETIHTRVEDYKEKHFDIITTRAVANLEKLLNYTKFIPLKGHIDEELNDINNKKLLEKYNLKIASQEKFMLPKENSTRNILVIEKNKV